MRNNVARSLIGVLAVAAWFGEEQFADGRLATIKSETEAATVAWPVSLVSDVVSDSFVDEIPSQQDVVSLSELLAANADAGAEDEVAIDDESDDGSSQFVSAEFASDRGASEAQPVRKQLRREFRVTAYCDRGTTAAGVPSGVGQCAAPSFIPFGSEIYIPALDRWFVVTDRTHQRFRHNTIDLFMPSRNQCLNFGRRFTDAVVVFPEKKHRYGCRSILKTVSAARSRDLQADANGKSLTLDGIVRAIFWGYSPLPSFSSRGGLNLGFPPVARHDEIADS